MSDITPSQTREVLVPQVPHPWLECTGWAAFLGIFLSQAMFGFLRGHAWDLALALPGIGLAVHRLRKACWDNVVEVPA